MRSNIKYSEKLTLTFHFEQMEQITFGSNHFGTNPVHWASSEGAKSSVFKDNNVTNQCLSNDHRKLMSWNWITRSGYKVAILRIESWKLVKRFFGVAMAYGDGRPINVDDNSLGFCICEHLGTKKILHHVRYNVIHIVWIWRYGHKIIVSV